MNRGEIWLINLDPTVGAEIKKMRPAVIISADGLGKLPLRVIIPITDWKDHYEVADWMVKILPNSGNGLSKSSSADCFQVRSVSTQRLMKKLGVIEPPTLEKIGTALEKVLKNLLQAYKSPPAPKHKRANTSLLKILHFLQPKPSPGDRFPAFASGRILFR